MIPSLAALARARLPRWAGRISVGNVTAWRPPLRFDFVRAGLEYVPQHKRPDLAQRLLDDYLAPRGRLILCSYGSSRRPEPRAEPVAGMLRGWGYQVAAEAEAADTNGVAITRIAWTDLDAQRP